LHINPFWFPVTKKSPKKPQGLYKFMKITKLQELN
jgi:hypothetical protein